MLHKNILYSLLCISVSLSALALNDTNQQSQDCIYASSYPSVQASHPYLILVPGWTLILEGTTSGIKKRLEWVVTDETRILNGIETRIVREREWRDGVLHEESRNFLAICQTQNDILQFGEESFGFEDGKIATVTKWYAGQDGVPIGLFMPGAPKAGMRFTNEDVPGEEEEQIEIQSIASKIIAGKSFENALTMKEISSSEKEPVGEAVYVPGIGLVKDDDGLVLVAYGYLGDIKNR